MGRKNNPKYDESVKMYERGLSIQNCANFYGITRQAMHGILRKRGVACRSNKRFGKENHFYRDGKKTASGRSREFVRQAVLKGIIERKTHCEGCGSVDQFKNGRTKIHAHHCDYNKPLEIMWLCQKCHYEWHKTNRAIKIIDLL